MFLIPETRYARIVPSHEKSTPSTRFYGHAWCTNIEVTPGVGAFAKCKNEISLLIFPTDPLVWKRKYLEQKKQTISLEEKLNKLKNQVDQYQRRLVRHIERRTERDAIKERLVSVER